MQTLSSFKALFDKKLEYFLDRKIQQIDKQASDPTLTDLFLHTKKIILSGGKRVRPYMVALNYQACGGRLTPAIWNILIGVELFHAFALMHDDVMDLGNHRHGVPTLHIYAEQYFKKQKRIGHFEHIGHSHAILIGDMLFAWANECLFLQPTIDRKILLTLQRIYTEMNQEVMLGQMLDVDGMTKLSVNTSQVLTKTAMKTAGYTFVQPLRMGWALAGSPKSLASFSEAFGRPLGIAFQIQDDLFDLIGTSEELGKEPFSDLRDGQHTLFSQYIVANGSSQQKNELKHLWSSQVNGLNASEIHNLFQESGAFAAVTRQMNQYFKKAEKVLDGTPLPQKEKALFLDLYEKICSRTS